MKNFYTSIAIVVGIILAVLVAAWLLGWGAAPLEVTSVQNVRKQFAEAYRNDESLRAAAGNICSARALVEQATSDDERIQRQTQVAAIESNYRRIAALYDQSVRNAFEAKYVLPADLPQRAPELGDAVRDRC